MSGSLGKIAQMLFSTNRPHAEEHVDMSTNVLEIPNLRLESEPEIQPIIRRRGRAARRRRVRRNFRRRALAGLLGGLVIAALGFLLMTKGPRPVPEQDAAPVLVELQAEAAAIYGG